MFRDNQGALALAKNLYLYERSKYINIYYYFIRDLIEKGKVDIKYINIVEMIVDGLTKLLLSRN